ncbi:acetate/propionate family kinase [Actinosynnema sp. CA-248983]
MAVLMNVLVVNAGSSSLKLSVLREDELLFQRHVERWEGGVVELPDDVPEIHAVGHRVVHGGADLTEPVRLDDQIRAEIERLTDLAPLHQPRALAGIDAMTALLPDVPQVACFDTAFHATLPPVATTYPLPAEWRRRWGLRRYGFHGLSHAYAARRAVALAGGGSRVVTCHLGAGCSLAAVRDGRSVDTTMGFTPLGGLVMATRSGDLDPGLLVWLLRGRLDLDALDDGLEHGSGLSGVGGRADLRDLRQAASDGDADAGLAIDVFVHRLRQGVAAMAASLGGLDVVVFTGGIGEHDTAVRADTLRGLGFLGVELDDSRNASLDGDGRISADRSAVGAWVVEAREDVEIAHGVRRLLG